jgi:hypothetical protein
MPAISCYQVDRSLTVAARNRSRSRDQREFVNGPAAHI